MQQSGIYCITNTINGKVYIGSSLDIPNRWKTHRYHLRHGKHHSPYLQRAWEKYGEEAFDFQAIEFLEPVEEVLIKRELEHIARMEACDPERGYNLQTPNDTNTRFTASEATRLKISEANKGKTKGIPKTEDHRRRIGETLKCRVFTEEHRRKISEAKKGRPSTFKGKTFSEESRLKISEARKRYEAKKRGEVPIDLPPVQVA